MTHQENNWAAPLPETRVEMPFAAINESATVRDAGKIGVWGALGTAVAATVLVGGIYLASDRDNAEGSADAPAAAEDNSDNEQPISEVVITETPEYKALEEKYDSDISDLEKQIAELEEMIKAQAENDTTDDEASDDESDEDAEATSGDDSELVNEAEELTVSEQITKNIEAMSDEELEEMYGLVDNPEWSENAREVGRMEEVTHENMLDLLRHDRDVLGQVAGCFAYAEYVDAQVANLGEICAGPDMHESMEEVMNAEIQRLLNADLSEVAYTAEMVIAKLHGGQLPANVEDLYELTSYTGTYGTTRLENRKDTIEGSSNTRTNDTWIVFDTVTLANGKTYEIAFRACGQIVIPIETPTPPPTTPPETPETPENPDHEPADDVPPVAETPAQDTDDTDGYDNGDAEDNEGDQETIEDGEEVDGEPTDSGTQIDDTEGTGAEGPTVGDDGVTESPDPDTADENTDYDPDTEVSEGTDGGNADAEETEAGNDDEEVDADGDGVGDDESDDNNGDSGGF